MRHRRLGLALVCLLVGLLICVSAWHQGRLLVERNAARADVTRIKDILYGPLFSTPPTRER